MTESEAITWEESQRLLEEERLRDEENRANFNFDMNEEFNPEALRQMIAEA